MKTIVPTGVAIGVALVILLSYISPNPILFDMRLALINWAVVLAGLAVLLGVLNLLRVHAGRLELGGPASAYSLLTIIALVVTLLIGVAEGFVAGRPVIYEQTSVTGMLFHGVVVASLATLASLVMVFLVIAAVRMLRERLSAWSILFLAVVLVALVGWVPLALLGPLNGFRDWLIGVPAMAGTRGILLGVALGTLVIGLRFITGSERPYQD